MRHRYQGFYTVEMCLVFPIVFIVILLLIDVAFYYYDMSLVHSRVYELLRCTEKEFIYGIDPLTQDQLKEKKEKVELDEYKQQLLSKGLFITEVSLNKCSLAGDKMVFEGICEITLPGLTLIKSWNPSAFQFPFEIEKDCICREERTRALFLIKEIAKKGKKEK